MAILEVKNLKKNFGELEVLKGIDFSLEKGEFGAMFTPWATYSRITSDKNTHDVTTFRAPGSFAYLMADKESATTENPAIPVANQRVTFLS